MLISLLYWIYQDELETHSKEDSISIFVHYGGDRTNDPRVIAKDDVVLTTYGVLTSAFKSVMLVTSNSFSAFSAPGTQFL